MRYAQLAVCMVIEDSFTAASCIFWSVLTDCCRSCKKLKEISVQFTEVKIFIWSMSPLWSKKTTVAATD